MCTQGQVQLYSGIRTVVLRHKYKCTQGQVHEHSSTVVLRNKYRCTQEKVQAYSVTSTCVLVDKYKCTHHLPTACVILQSPSGTVSTRHL